MELKLLMAIFMTYLLCIYSYQCLIKCKHTLPVADTPSAPVMIPNRTAGTDNQRLLTDQSDCHPSHTSASLTLKHREGICHSHAQHASDDGCDREKEHFHAQLVLWRSVLKPWRTLSRSRSD